MKLFLRIFSRRARTWAEVLGATPRHARLVSKPSKSGGTCFLMYYDKVSAQPLELDHEPGALILRLPLLFADDDALLALLLVEQASRLLEGTIQTAEGWTVPISELRGERIGEWLARGMAEVMVLLIRLSETGEVRELSGTVRPSWLGPRTSRRLLRNFPAIEVRDRTIDAVRRIQYLEPGSCEVAIPAVARDAGREVRVVSWGPGRSWFFPRAELASLAQPGKGLLYVPLGAVPEIAGPRCEWLDDCQLLLQSVDEREWPALVERAHPFRLRLAD